MAATNTPCINNALVVDESPSVNSPAWHMDHEKIHPGGSNHISTQRYLKQVLLHPCHIALVIAVVVFATLTKSIWLMPIALLVEIVFSSIVGCARKAIRPSGMEADALLPPAYRGQRISKLSEEHRGELEQLEVQVANICGNYGSTSKLLVEHVSDLTLLLRAYVDLAAAYQEYATAIAVIDRVQLADELRSLDDVKGLVSERLKQLIACRRDVIRQRIDYWDQNNEAMKEIEHQLATIANIIGLLHEKSIVRSQTDWVSDEVGRILENVKQHELALLELKL